MSIDLALNASATDLVFDKAGRASLIDGIERVRQQVTIALRTWRGEWFLDETVGIPYLDSILVKSPRISTIDAVVRGVVNAVPGVKRITRLDVEINRELRTLALSMDIDSAVGMVRVPALTLG